MISRLALLAALFERTAAADWAVLVAASFQYNNYRHQSDVCHAYHVLSARGIPDSNIIVMLYDDAANDEGNPLPGTLYNSPMGENVYEGCKKDYTQKAVTASNFLSVISGNTSGVFPAGLPVLKSTSEDNVFIFYADHGASGFLAFPASHLYAADLNTALTQGHAKGLWRKAVFYVEACEAGSMFDQIIDPSIGVYVVTASNPTESSWGVNCPPFDKAHGQSIGTCLGDLFAVSWMNDTLASSASESFETQFENARDRVAKGTSGLYPHSSHVMQYGDVSFTAEPISNFEGAAPSEAAAFSRGDAIVGDIDAGMVPSREIPLHLAYYRYLRTDKADVKSRRASAVALRAQLDGQIAADDLFMDWATEVTGDSAVAEALVVATPNGIATACGACCRTIHESYLESCGGYDGYSIQYARLVTNLCGYGDAGSDGTKLAAKLIARCSSGKLPEVVV